MTIHPPNLGGEFHPQHFGGMGCLRVFIPKVMGYSEAWEPPQFQEKRSRSEKAILGALGEFRGILGATLGIRNSILGIRNSILGIASHDLSNTKTTILGATPGAIPGSDGNPHEIFSFAPRFSERFFKLGWSPRARDMGWDPDCLVQRRSCRICLCTTGHRCNLEVAPEQESEVFFSLHLPCEIAEALVISSVFLQVLVGFQSISIDFLSFPDGPKIETFQDRPPD